MHRLSLAISLLLLAACQPQPASQPTRPAGQAIPQATAAFPFEEASVASLQQQMGSGGLTSRKLTQAYLDRIAAIDDAPEAQRGDRNHPDP